MSHETSPEGAHGEVRWQSKRNCSLAPKQALACYAPLCALLAVVGLACWRIGALWVLPFAALEIAAVAAAVLAYARHAGDRETVELRGGRVLVRHCDGDRVNEVEFAPDWVRVARPDDECTLIEVSGPGRCAHIGRYVRPEKRPRVADELRQTLRQHLS